VGPLAQGSMELLALVAPPCSSNTYLPNHRESGGVESDRGPSHNSSAARPQAPSSCYLFHPASASQGELDAGEVVDEDLASGSKM